MGNERWTLTYTDKRGVMHNTGVIREMSATGGGPFELTQTFPDASLQRGVAHLTDGDYYDYTTKTYIGPKSWDVPILCYVNPTPQKVGIPGVPSTITQKNYGLPPKSERVGLTTAGADTWSKHVRGLIQAMRRLLPPGHGLARTGIIKEGDHSRYQKMDVAPRNGTTWDELAHAAYQVGFWVHAEGVTLDGVNWPLSKKATGPHLDLYLRPGNPPAPLFPRGMTWESGYAGQLTPDD